MLYALALALLILWMLGMAGGYTVGLSIHSLLLAAIVLVFIQLIARRRAPL